MQRLYPDGSRPRTAVRNKHEPVEVVASWTGRDLCVMTSHPRTLGHSTIQSWEPPIAQYLPLYTLSFVHPILCNLKLKWTSSKDNTAGRSHGLKRLGVSLSFYLQLLWILLDGWGQGCDDSCCGPCYNMRSHDRWSTRIYGVINPWQADPRGRAVKGVDLRPIACWGCGFESHQGHRCLSLVSVVCCQVEVSPTSRSLVQRRPIEFGVSECDRAASTMRRPWPTRSCCAMVEGNYDRTNPN
jgi:hypothetical protein